MADPFDDEVEQIDNRSCCLRLIDPKLDQCQICVSKCEEEGYPPIARLHRCLVMLFAFLAVAALIVIAFKMDNGFSPYRYYLTIPIFFAVLSALFCFLMCRAVNYCGKLPK